MKSSTEHRTDIISSAATNTSDSTNEASLDKSQVAEAKDDLQRIQKAHQWDPNLPQEKLDAVQLAVEHGDAADIVDADAMFTENSPYEEVRAAVRNTDGGEVANTVRAWILGMSFVTVGSGLNMFLSMRFVSL